MATNRIVHTCYKCDKAIVCQSRTRRPEVKPCKMKPPHLCAECAAKSE